VLDTNVIVSALLLPRSVPRQAFDSALSRGIFLVSDDTLSELKIVLSRPRFNRYVKQEDRLQFLVNFIKGSVVIEVRETVTDCRDPKDNKFLELAISGNATLIITGDRDLLSLHPFRDIPIMTPRDYLSTIQN
jgi:putative PIN family toxin of toxin-antitoxin system